MPVASEDSPLTRRPSNPRAPWALLARACRELGAGLGGVPPLGRVLRLALEASGAERAFVVLAAQDGSHASPTVEAFRGKREDGREAPSRSVLLRALAGDRPYVCFDTRIDPELNDGRSVRALALRSVVAARIPCVGDGRRVLVLDSRRPTSLDANDAREIVRAFADLVGLALAGNPSARRSDVLPPTPDDGDGSTQAISGRGPAMLDLVDSLERMAGCELPVLVLGETGSGKEAVARALHDGSRRASGPFVPLNCTAFTETLLEAELFGAVRGAYTGLDRDRLGLFRLAHGGTLFLDEIGDMPPGMQAKLLRVIQEGRLRPVGAEDEIDVDVRVVSATHRELARDAREGRFRADLYYRLAVLELRVPALRDRLEDLDAVIESLGPRLRHEVGHGPPVLAPCALEALRTHAWPGNVRELHAVLARALLRTGCGRTIRARDLGVPVPVAPQPDRVEVRAGGLEREMIERALLAANRSVTLAARRIGWTRQKLYRRMQALAIDPMGEATATPKDAQSESCSPRASSESSTFQ